MHNRNKTIIIIMILLTSLNAAYAAAWQPVKSMWSEKDEQIYSAFTQALCDSKYHNLNDFIRDAAANPLYSPEDNKFDLKPDCADLPYLLRAYVAYKLRLPFLYTCRISGNGGDIRYSKGNRPEAYKSHNDFVSPQDLFYKILLVNSGFYRMAADLNVTDSYPIKVSQKSIIPGTIYYDPNGHVAVVGKITEDGRIRMMDAHPDKTISKPWFGAKFNSGTKYNGGGFRRWRPVRIQRDGRMILTGNHNLPDYSENDQYRREYSFGGSRGLKYHDYVRAVVSRVRETDPVKEFVFMMKELYEDVVYRSMAVDVALKLHMPGVPHPGKLPWNIYGTDGVWEAYSTPSRDARLKVAFKEFYDNTRKMILYLASFNFNAARQAAALMLMKYNELSPRLVVSYTNTEGKNVTLSFDDVMTRLFDLSFDPYHSPELRWGAYGRELATADDDEVKKHFYSVESRLRNNLERVYGMPTPLNFGPEKAPSVNIRVWLEAFLRGENPDLTVEKAPASYERVADNIPRKLPQLAAAGSIPEKGIQENKGNIQKHSYKARNQKSVQPAASVGRTYSKGSRKRSYGYIDVEGSRDQVVSTVNRRNIPRTKPNPPVKKVIPSMPKRNVNNANNPSYNYSTSPYLKRPVTTPWMSGVRDVTWGSQK